MMSKNIPCAVDAVLAMDPLPARVVVFGDIALWFGLDTDYETSQPILKRLTDAGIDLYVTTGNHDHRAPLFRFYPRQAEITPVKGEKRPREWDEILSENRGAVCTFTY